MTNHLNGLKNHVSHNNYQVLIIKLLLLRANLIVIIVLHDQLYLDDRMGTLPSIIQTHINASLLLCKKELFIMKKKGEISESREILEFVSFERITTAFFMCMVHCILFLFSLAPRVNSPVVFEFEHLYGSYHLHGGPSFG